MSTITFLFFFFFQAEDGIRDKLVTGVQTCALPISVVIKRFKPQQDRRFDLPAIGPGTIRAMADCGAAVLAIEAGRAVRSEEHTSELQSLAYLVCRLLLEKKNILDLTEDAFDFLTSN